MSEKEQTKEEQQLELGKKIQAFYDQGYIDRKATIGFSFLKGLASGIGGILGATLILALLIWMLSFFNEVPIIGPFVDTVKSTIEHRPR